MKRIIWVFIFSGFFIANSITQTSISGIINNYAKVTAIDTICQVKLTVDDTTGFEIGMKAILIQMKGATINETNTASFGEITDMGAAGWYEKNEIDSVGENCIFLTFQLSHDYEIAGKVQLVSMPGFENATVADTLTAGLWNGEKGGVLAFSVENDLVLNENIDVSGKGFRGGNSISINPNNCSWLNQQTDYYYNLNNWRGAEKGEGITEHITSKEAGKGPQATGGGGGNDHNAGGGGGSNTSPGGEGGTNNEPSLFGCKGNHPGLGGAVVLDDIDRIFFGGGGGAGHGNNDLGTNGGNGGGIVILEAGSFTGNGFKILANGLTPIEGGSDGAGGGGSGGTLVMNINTINDMMSFEVKGGDGGLVNNTGQERCHGPGGGGSGGRLLINQGLGPWNVDYDGGVAGLSINSSTCPATSNGAQSGSNGNYLLFYDLVESDIELEGPISIEDQTLLQEVCEGGEAFFIVSANGNPTNYQWQVDTGTGFQDITDGAEYAGTMTDSLIILNPTELMSGWLFQCIISNNCSEITTEEALLEVATAASISIQPESTTVCEIGEAEFFVMASGSNIQYQWQVDEGSGFQNITDGADYFGTMTNSLTVLNPTILMNDWLFQCVITTDCGNLVSESAVLEVIGSAHVTTQPESTTVCEGQDVDFFVFVVGSNIQYQWQVDDGSGFQDVNDGAVYSGTMTSTLTVLNSTMLMNGWLFQCVMETDCGDAVTESAILEVTTAASISIQPESTTVCEFGEAEFSVMASGSNIQYQWQVDDGSGFQNISDGADYFGTMTNSLTVLNPTILMNDWLFQCLITTDCGNLVSESAILEVIGSAHVTTQPESTTACEGQDVDFFVFVVGSNIQYQWQVDDGSGFQDVNDGAAYSGTMTSTLTVLNSTMLMNGWLFQCVMETDCGDAVTETALLEITASASISTQPESVTACQGNSTDFFVAISGSNIQYQWQVDDGSGFQNINDGVVYSGTMTETLTILNPIFIMSGWIFQCVVTTDCGDLTSNGATLEVIVAPFVSIHPESLIACEDSSASFKVNVAGSTGPFEYQWQVDEGAGFYDLIDNAIYSNTGTATLGISTTSLAMNGYIYRCILTYECGTVISDEAQLNIEIAPTAQFDFLVNGSLVDFNNLSSFNTFGYSWDFGDNSNSTQVDPSHNYAQNGVYLVQLIAFNDCGADTITQEVEVSFLESPAAAFSLDNGTGCAPLLVQFLDESTGDIDSWQWTFPGGNPNNSSDQNPQVIYETPGTFDVILEVTNSAGGDAITYENYIFVDLPIFAGFNSSVNENVVSFTNTTQNATAFEWDFGDNSPKSTEENPVHEYTFPGVYHVTLVTTNPLCGSAITKVVDVIFTGIDELNEEAWIEVFPNPVNDILSIKFLKNVGPKTIRLFHVNGQKVLEKQYDGNDFLEIELSGKSSGMYILEVLIDDKVFIEKILKN